MKNSALVVIDLPGLRCKKLEDYIDGKNTL